MTRATSPLLGEREGFVGCWVPWMQSSSGCAASRSVKSNSLGVAGFRLGVVRLATKVLDANKAKAPVVLTELLSQARHPRGSRRSEVVSEVLREFEAAGLTEMRRQGFGLCTTAGLRALSWRHSAAVGGRTQGQLPPAGGRPTPGG